ncbi:tRNA dihydrouridine synthase DusB [Neisseria animalis]|uniref:tRNA-dihydrouridine synthase B n=1 Tax=Neisseria animalis TaxID=492 RepID=A0A5P3MP39_NEIAN|nr:tRNA dihydrouridine synthase DusB [Neisseria animalis]QEY23302.1 tRNA dihydrouridine synthase DusB [Neisseria animalis]ROW33151.1 tRNA dihydrouridine synthase DusB [Neisseria animalis]VEE08631.1 tRNA-dihydrouridine synthase B [Neisseria animalis]
MNIGTYHIETPIALAPMAGITDKPFRRLCRAYGAGWAVGEMLTSDPSLRHTKKSQYRSDFSAENGIIAVQILGNDPAVMAEAARYNIAQGAQVIDINMGCPAKKVCNVAAGSALMQNEKLVARILEAVVGASTVPVTLKTRLGWADEHKNLPAIAKIAEESGIAALAVHGRTRTQMYKGEAEYGLIAEVKSRLHIPVWVNGDITSPQKAAAVQAQTGADGVMIGRGAQGQPWLFRDIKHYLAHKTLPPPLSLAECSRTILAHLQAMHTFYGSADGLRIARKHLGWYLSPMPEGEAVRRAINQINDAAEQYDAVAAYLDKLPQYTDQWASSYR